MRRADNLTTFMSRLSKNLGASTSWNPKGLPRPVMIALPFTYQKHTTLYEFQRFPQPVKVTMCIFVKMCVITERAFSPVSCVQTTYRYEAVLR